MAEEKFVFAEQEFTYEKTEESWVLTLRRSDVASQDLRELLLLQLHHPLFLEQTMSDDADQVVFSYAIEPLGLSQEAIEKKTVSERIRLALNVFALKAALELPVTFLLHPSNLYISKDAQPKIAYRGIPGIMVPDSLDAEDFLRQAKCYAVTLFGDYDFMDLYNGSLELEDLPDFLVELREAEDLPAAEAVLEKAYEEKAAEEAEKLTLVGKRSYKVYRLAAIWLSALALALIIPLVYLIFIQNPFKEKLLKADTAYIKVDYSGVIRELKGIEPARLPNTQKYELAYSYIQGLQFSDDQRKVILNNVTLKSDPLYLHYWIQIGRNDYEDALDTAKRINDSDLIIYAITQGMKQVREDDKLSGKDRESKLQSLESDYKKYWDSRNELLNGSSTSGSSTAPSGEETKPTSSEQPAPAPAPSSDQPAPAPSTTP